MLRLLKILERNNRVINFISDHLRLISWAKIIIVEIVMIIRKNRNIMIHISINIVLRG
jgi:hypothetical protein